MIKHKLLIFSGDSINVDTLINHNASIYFAKFKTLFINTDEQYIIAISENILTDIIFKFYPNIKIYTNLNFKLNLSFTINSIIFKDKPEYRLNYLEFYRYKKIKLSNVAINKSINIWQLNSKFNTIKSFEKLVNDVTKEIFIKYDINSNWDELENKYNLSQLKLRTYNNNIVGRYSYSSINKTIKTIFVNKSQLKDIQKLFELERQYSHNLASLIKLINSAVKYFKKYYNTIYNHDLLKIVINVKIEHNANTVIEHNTNTLIDLDEDINFNDIITLDYITIVFANIFAIKLNSLDELKDITLLKYFDLMNLESEIQYFLLKQL